MHAEHKYTTSTRPNKNNTTSRIPQNTRITHQTITQHLSSITWHTTIIVYVLLFDTNDTNDELIRILPITV